MAICRSGTSVGKVYMTAVAGWDCQRGITAEFMEMVVMRVCTEFYSVEVAATTWNRIAGHGCITMVVASFASFCVDRASDNFMGMASVECEEVGCICIKVAHN